jgi:hypothetical protein
MTSNLLGPGSTVLIGAPSSNQLFVGDHLAFTYARQGGTVVFLSERDRPDRAVIDRLDAWVEAKKVQRSIVIHRLTGAKRWQTVADVLEALRLAEIAGPDILLVRDMSGDQALQPSDTWLKSAAELADAGIRCLLLAHWGGGPRPDLAAYAGVVIEVSVGARLSATLIQRKPAGGIVAEFKGRALQSTIVFEEVAP